MTSLDVICFPLKDMEIIITYSNKCENLNLFFISRVFFNLAYLFMTLRTIVSFLVYDSRNY